MFIFDHDYVPGFPVKMDIYSGTDAWHTKLNRHSFLRKEREIKIIQNWMSSILRICAWTQAILVVETR